MITLQNILDVANATLKIAAEKGYLVDEELTYSVNHRLTLSLGRFLVKTVTIGAEEQKYYSIDITSRFHDVCDEFVDTVRHEIAHFVAFLNFGDLSHGKQWKKIAVELGANPSPKALVPDAQIAPAKPRKRNRKTRAKCVCCPTIYKVNSVTKMQVRQGMILCPTCKQKKLYLILSEV